MPSYFDLLKYAATGQASPSMTYYDRMMASTLMGGAGKTLTGIPPLSFKSDGTPLTSVTIKGNGVQNGTPSPQNIVPFDGTGERTGQLIPYPFKSPDSSQGGLAFTTNAYGTIKASGKTTVGFVFKLYEGKFEAGTYTLKIFGKHDGTSLRVRNVDASTQITVIAESEVSKTFTIRSDISICLIYLNTSQANIDVDIDCTVMLVSGSTEPTTYEPYGYKIPLTCASVTTPLYLGEVSTTRRIGKLVLTGEEAWTLEDGITYTTSIEMPLYGYTNAICTHYPLATSYTSLIATDITFSVSKRPALFIHDSSFANAAALKSYLRDQYSAGTPVVVWYVLATEQTGIVNEPLCKIGDYADELHSSDAGVSIPTAKGDNTLTVDTDLQPSEMTIKYR